MSLKILNEMLDDIDLERIVTRRQPWLKQVETWKAEHALAYEFTFL